MSQNELFENLSHWDYINNYSVWMYHKYEPNIGDRVFDVGAGMGRMVEFYIGQCKRVTATDIFQSQVDYMNQRFGKFHNFEAILLDVMQDDISSFRGVQHSALHKCIGVFGG